MSLASQAAALCLGALPCLTGVLPWSADEPVDQDRPGRGAVGSTAGEFVLEGPNGGSLRFPDRTSGDVELTVVVFWATWSRHSASELTRLAELWPKWSRHGVRLVAVNVERSHITATELQVVSEFVEQQALPFPVVMDRQLETFHAYGVIAVPTTFVIDSKGMVVFRLPGFPIAGAETLIETVEGLVLDTPWNSAEAPSALTPTSRSAVRHTRLARLLAQKGELELAEYTLLKAIGEDPMLLAPRLELARLYRSVARLDDAGRTLEEADATFPEEPRLLLARAELGLQLGDRTVARSLARRAYELNPSLGHALVLLGQVCEAEGDHGQALELLEQAARLNPLDLSARMELGRVCEARGRKQDAYRWYEEAYGLLDPAWTR